MVAKAAVAGPPFMTDDPEPIEKGHSEAYLFSTYDGGPDHTKSSQLPAFEYNTGPLEDLHLHAVLPFSNFNPGDGSRVQHGLGDIELGVKYRFVHESDDTPQVGIFPMLELPNGDAARGLGNGRAWWTLPVWAQKSWGDWTVYGGGGRAFNSAPSMRNYNFGGLTVQRKITGKLVLGGEIFGQGASSINAQHATFANIGGYYNDISACGGCSLLFRAGHSIAGESHTTAYLGLYWTWASEHHG